MLWKRNNLLAIMPRKYILRGRFEGWESSDGLKRFRPSMYKKNPRGKHQSNFEQRTSKDVNWDDAKDPNQICMLILIEVLILIKRIYLHLNLQVRGLKYFDMPKIYVHDFSFDYIELENRLNENDFFCGVRVHFNFSPDDPGDGWDNLEYFFVSVATPFGFPNYLKRCIDKRFVS